MADQTSPAFPLAIRTLNFRDDDYEIRQQENGNWHLIDPEGDFVLASVRDLGDDAYYLMLSHGFDKFIEGQRLGSTTARNAIMCQLGGPSMEQVSRLENRICELEAAK